MAVPLLLGVGVVTYLDYISVWTAFVVLLVLGVMWVVYEKWEEADDRKEELERKLEEKEKRKAVKDLLGDAVDRGKDLQITARNEGETLKLVSKQDVEEWVHHTRDFIEAAFDKGEARHFLNSEGYEPGNPPPFRNTRRDPYKYFIEIRLLRLDELIVRANTLEINPNFDP